jgi:carboxylesterase type B
MVGHFAELDLIWGIPFINQTMAYKMNLSYTKEEIELSLQMIRYWTNFVKTGKNKNS